MNLYRVIIVLLFFFQNSILIHAQNPVLRFNKDKKFKIVQFTDLHICYKDSRSDVAFERMNQVLDAERPDIVVFTGDLIYSSPADANLRNVVETVSKRKIPFVVTFGNHDQEQGLTNEELFKVLTKIPYNITRDEQPELTGVGNCALSIKSSNGDKTSFVLYCIDSHRNCSIKGVEGYDFIKSDQINWYKKRSSEFRKENNGETVPALCFFHIPLPEFNQAAESENSSLYGVRRERACSPKLNSGMFSAMKECGDIVGVFVGHDHDNDYAVNWHGVLLAYGRFSGGPTEYNHIPNGARVIELTEGENGCKTWIRTSSKSVMTKVSFPDDFVIKD